jgi:2-keto-4-pentenoate hydratase/2-oxohepta-3-ene-1,7-dioic acid hydratase in catechol pathway
MTLNPGDLIITGTPSGVGPVKDGDYVEALLLEEGKLLASRKFTVKKQAEAKL